MVAQAFEAVAMGAGTAIKKVLFGLGEIIPEARLQKAIDEGINPLALGAAAVAAVLMPVLLPALLVTAGQFVFVSSVLAALAPVLLTVAAAMTAFVGFATLAGVVLGIFWAVAGAVVATLVTLVTAIGLAVGAIFVALNPVLAFGVIVAAGVIAVGMFLASVVAAAGAVLLLGAIFFSMVGFLAKLATETEAFGRISGMFEASVGRIIAALEPFVSSLTPIVGLFDGFADIIIAFAESVFSGDAIIRVVWETLKAFAVVLGGVVLAAAIVGSALLDVVTGVAYGVRSILGAIAGPVEFFIDAILTGVSFFVGEMAVILGLFSEGAASAMRDIQDEVNSFRSRNQVNMLQDALAGLAAAASQARPDIGAMSDALSNLAAMSMEEADARARNLAIMQEFGESLTNVPEAVKVSRLRYEAITPGLSGGSINPADSQESSGGRTINNYIDRLEIRAASVDDFLNQLEEASEEQSMRERGTTRGGGIQNNGR